MQHFPSALGVDDFISRVETVLSGYGFTGDNSIGKPDGRAPLFHLGVPGNTSKQCINKWRLTTFACCAACTNLCRDEVTAVLKDKIESVFGSSFNTNGLGGVLTCGVTGMGAGLSHSPICVSAWAGWAGVSATLTSAWCCTQLVARFTQCVLQRD